MSICYVFIYISSQSMQQKRTITSPDCKSATKPAFHRKNAAYSEQKQPLSAKDQRLRQNYIINRDHVYTSLQDQFLQLANKPEFNRFISNKEIKQILTNEQLIAREIVRNHSGKDRDTSERNIVRRRVLFQKMRRPEHNSPLKRGVKQSEVQLTRITEAEDVAVKNKPRRKLLADQSENALMIKQMVTHFDQPKKIRFMERNPYPASSKEREYYTTEVKKYYSEYDSLARDHILNSIYFLELLSRYNNTSDFAEDKPIKLPQKPYYKDKITVVFDLDQTLVHCFEELSEPHQVAIPVISPGRKTMMAPVNIRPHAKEIIAELAKDFQLIIFTASHEHYANAVIDYLDPTKEFIQHRLYRRHCDYIEEGYHIKDLRLLGRDLSRVVIVDNAAYSYAFQVDNGIPIIPYYEGTNDYELQALQGYLNALKKYKDVRTLNAKTFKQGKYTAFATVQDLVEELYLKQ